MITLYQFQISPFCDKVRRIMNWKQLDYKIEEVSLMKLLGIKKKYQVVKLPFIEHEGKTIGDSTDIAYYLEEKFPEKPILPKDPGERALVHFFEDWSDEGLYFYEMRLRFGITHNAKKTIPELAHADSRIIKALSPMIVSSKTKSSLSHQGLGGKSDEQILIDVNRHVEAVGNHLSMKQIGWWAVLYPWPISAYLPNCFVSETVLKD